MSQQKTLDSTELDWLRSMRTALRQQLQLWMFVNKDEGCRFVANVINGIRLIVEKEMKLEDSSSVETIQSPFKSLDDQNNSSEEIKLQNLQISNPNMTTVSMEKEMEWLRCIRENVQVQIEIFEFVHTTRKTREPNQCDNLDLDVLSMLQQLKEMTGERIFENLSTPQDLDLNLTQMLPTNPLENLLVLNKVLSHLSGKEIRICRLVKRQWRNEVSSILTNSNKYLKVDFPLFSIRLGIQQVTQWGYPREKSKLERFIDFLSNHETNWKDSKFPCTNFHFKNGDLGNLLVEKLFTSKFIDIHSLNLELKLFDGGSPNYTTMSSFRKILLEHVPNLQRLHLVNTPTQWNHIDMRIQASSQLFPDPQGTIKLSNLKSLTSDYADSWVISSIVQVAPNLMKIDTCPFENFDNIPITQIKSKTFQVLELFPTRENLNFYDKFAMSKFCLKNLKFNFESICTTPDLWPRVSHVINMLFESSQDSLKSIEQFHPLDFLPGIIIPTFPNLTNLVFGDSFIYYKGNAIQNHRMFPKDSIKLSQMIPKARKVNFRLQGPISSSLAWESIFDHVQDDQLSFVNDLSVNYFRYDESWIPKLAYTFPSVETLSFLFQSITVMAKICESIWTCFPNVKSLWIVPLGGCEVETIAMDSAITGIPLEICAQLLTSSRTVTVEEADKLRTSPSVCSLKNLKTLNFTFWEFNAHWKTPLFSHVSGIYGFQCLPNVSKVVFNRHHIGSPTKNYLAAWDPIRPYVKLVDCDCC